MRFRGVGYIILYMLLPALKISLRIQNNLLKIFFSMKAPTRETRGRSLLFTLCTSILFELFLMHTLIFK